MSVSTASADFHIATASDASAPATATSMNPKIPITGAIVFLLQGSMAPGARGSTTFDLAASFDLLRLGASELNAHLVILTAAGTVAVIAVAAFDHSQRRRRIPIWAAVLIDVGFTLVFLTQAGAGSRGIAPLVTILFSALGLSIPLAYGLLTGIIEERLDTINVATEGQLLGGAFPGTIVASACSSPWVGVLAVPVAGALVALLLVLFGLRYQIDQIVVGVVLNVLASELVGSLFFTLLSSSPSLNQALRLPALAVPLLSRIPIIGLVLFRQTILVYLMYMAVATLSAMLFRSRWRLRSRACGEYPKAADTVDISVIRTRVANLVLAGVLAEPGGAFLTVGSGLSFESDMIVGNGYIVLAVTILGAWWPLGSLKTAPLFGPAISVAQTLPVIGSSVSPDIISMIPYIVMILAVAGFVGKACAPVAEGVPYP